MYKEIQYFCSYTVASVCLLLVLSSCEQTFEPLQENDEYIFSMHGYLDASADTQWVRVMPVRDQLFADPDSIDVEVTLEHLESGEPLALNDSLFRYESAYTWNVWTTDDLEPGGSYRLRAERSDGRSSEVVVRLPEDFPDPKVRIAGHYTTPDVVMIEGVGELAEVQTRHHQRAIESGHERLFRSVYGEIVTSHARPNEMEVLLSREKLSAAMSSYWRTLISPNAPAVIMWDSQHVEFIHDQIHIVAAGPDWPDFDGLSEAEMSLPDGISNVENGVGYVAGVLSKTVPYAECRDESDQLIACPLEELMRREVMIELEVEE